MSEQAAKSDAPRHRDGGWLFWTSVAIGWTVIGFGVRGLLDQHTQTHPRNFTIFFVGSALAHDGVWIPLVLVGGAALRRTLSPNARRPVMWAAATSAVFLLIAWPFVRGYGRRPDNPSLLPRDYSAGVLAYVAVVWTLAAAWFAAAQWRLRRRRRESR